MHISNQFSIPSVLSIGGFDGSGGAGIQADNKTCYALGCYGLNVLSCLSIQNTLGVKTITHFPTDSFKKQLDSIFEDSYPNSIKIGMLHSKEQFSILKSYLESYEGFVVYDPVLVSSSGYNFVDQQDLLPSIQEILPHIHLITPNLNELSFLLSTPINTLEDMKAAIPQISTWPCEAALIKGGHLKTDQLTNILIEKNHKINYYSSQKIESKNTHGTGCTISSAIACYVAKGYPLQNAVAASTLYVHEAICRAKQYKIGQGNGGLIHHFATHNNPFS